MAWRCQEREAVWDGETFNCFVFFRRVFLWLITFNIRVIIGLLMCILMKNWLQIRYFPLQNRAPRKYDTWRVRTHCKRAALLLFLTHRRIHSSFITKQRRQSGRGAFIATQWASFGNEKRRA
jgi:hypothetical protein